MREDAREDRAGKIPTLTLIDVEDRCLAAVARPAADANNFVIDVSPLGNRNALTPIDRRAYSVSRLEREKAICYNDRARMAHREAP